MTTDTTPNSEPLASTVVVDESAYPLVAFSWVGALDAEGFRAYLAALDTLLAYEDRFALVVDASRAKGLSSDQRRLQDEWVQARAPSLKIYCAGMCLVIASPWVRRLLAAASRFRSLPYPTAVVATRAAGVAWAQTRLDTA